MALLRRAVGLRLKCELTCARSWSIDSASLNYVMVCMTLPSEMVAFSGVVRHVQHLANAEMRRRSLIMKSDDEGNKSDTLFVYGGRDVPHEWVMISHMGLATTTCSLAVQVTVSCRMKGGRRDLPTSTVAAIHDNQRAM